LNKNPKLREAFDNAINRIPELKYIKEEMNRYMSSQGYMNKTNPLIIENKMQEKILQDKKLLLMRSKMNELLLQYGFLMPVGEKEQQQEPLDIFGPKDRQAAILKGSIPPRRIGMQAVSKQEYDKAFLADKSLLYKIQYRIQSIFNKWLY
jgi:hypothetical protein